ncbi:MAG: hypothetical protein DRP55_07450 [Spirochaetes bacterium]|nr:MAG: hypothetical protein DRP55_07450 [Spirochaetota bacterium]RLG01456.1 MAG: hypothetical protein DRN58_01720 [Thermococci archaeon]
MRRECWKQSLEMSKSIQIFGDSRTLRSLIFYTLWDIVSCGALKKNVLVKLEKYTEVEKYGKKR